MKWIAVAILLCIVPYTIVTLQYRKPGKAFEPFEDLKKRANVSRLVSAGYQRIPLAASRPADGPRTHGGAAVTTTEGGIPETLRKTLVDVPLLPTEIIGVTAGPTANMLLPYSIEFTCTLPSDKQQLGGADLYVRENELVLAPTFEKITGDLSARTEKSLVLLTIPAGALKPGNYTVTLLGERASRTWPLEVK
jgi:hypothetical protein